MSSYGCTCVCVCVCVCVCCERRVPLEIITAADVFFRPCGIICLFDSGRFTTAKNIVLFKKKWRLGREDNTEMEMKGQAVPWDCIFSRGSCSDCLLEIVQMLGPDYVSMLRLSQSTKFALYTCRTLRRFEDLKAGGRYAPWADDDETDRNSIVPSPLDKKAWELRVQPGAVLNILNAWPHMPIGFVFEAKSVADMRLLSLTIIPRMHGGSLTVRWTPAAASEFYNQKNTPDQAFEKNNCFSEFLLAIEQNRSLVEINMHCATAPCRPPWGGLVEKQSPRTWLSHLSHLENICLSTVRGCRLRELQNAVQIHTAELPNTDAEMAVLMKDLQELFQKEKLQLFVFAAPPCRRFQKLNVCVIGKISKTEVRIAARLRDRLWFQRVPVKILFRLRPKSRYSGISTIPF